METSSSCTRVLRRAIWPAAAALAAIVGFVGWARQPAALEPAVERFTT